MDCIEGEGALQVEMSARTQKKAPGLMNLPGAAGIRYYA
jgi:hypothetical protein